MRCHHPLPFIAIMLLLALLVVPLTGLCRQLTPRLDLQMHGGQVLLCHLSADGSSRHCQAMF